MRKKLLALAFMLVMTLTFVLAACGKPKFEEATGVAYGASHTQTLTRYTLKIDKDHKVTDVRMDDVFLPHDFTHWTSTAGNLTAQSRSALGYFVGEKPTDTAKTHTASNAFVVPYKFAYADWQTIDASDNTTAEKNDMLSGRNAVAATDTTPAKPAISTKLTTTPFNSASVQIPEKFRNRMTYGANTQATLGENVFYRGIYADYYIDQVIAKKVYVMTLGTSADFDLAIPLTTVSTGATGDEKMYYKLVQPVPGSVTLNKWDEANTYWGTALTGMLNARYSFKQNVEEMNKFIKEHLNYNSNIIGATRTVAESVTWRKEGATANSTVSVSYWIVDGVTTGATLDDFRDYLVVAKQAYDNAYLAQMEKAYNKK